MLKSSCRLPPCEQAYLKRSLLIKKVPLSASSPRTGSRCQMLAEKPALDKSKTVQPQLWLVSNKI